tara:strand:+ start:252 stop:1166 length:915 start_codon:yes stop_codon:yes gene_type:complete
MAKRFIFNQIILINIIFFFSLSCEENKTQEEIYEENSRVLILTDENQGQLSGFSDIRLAIDNFPRIWKIYLTLINAPSLNVDKKILLDTTSAQDDTLYTVPWNTIEYPNGNYELYTEIIDSSNNLITSTSNVYIKNYSIITIENKLEVSATYKIGSQNGECFSNSISHVQVENFFDNIFLDCTSAIPFCGNQFLFNYSISPGSSNSKVSITPTNEYFFLKINNMSNENISIHTIIIKNGTSDEICEGLLIPSNGQVYPIGYFSFDFDNYISENISVVTIMNDISDTNIISLYNYNVLIDTIVVN